MALNIDYFFQKVDKLNNCSMGYLWRPYGISIWSSQLFITHWVLAHGMYKTIDLIFDCNILRTTEAMENLTPPADCACSSCYYRYKRTKAGNGKNTKETKFSIKKMICHKVTNLLSRGLRLCVNTSFVNPKLLMTVDWNTNSSINGSSGPPSFPWVNGTISEKYYPKNRGYHFYQEAHCCLFRVRVINFFYNILFIL